MKVLLTTDAFPPVCGGSGWSTYELARGLRARDIDVRVLHVRPGSHERVQRKEYEGFPVLEYGATAPAVPYVRNYFKNERLYARLPGFLAPIVKAEGIDIVHGQHVLTCLPSIDAAHQAGVPAVCTVRDYWPVCYWSDLIYSDSGADLCPGCSVGMMSRCVQPRAGALWPLALPMIPYMRGNLARKRSGLARADAVVAVSSTIARDLRTRAPELASARIEVIANPTDIADLRRRAAATARPIAQPYALYLGKLAPNKGTSHLVSVAARSGLDWPLIVAGDGPERSELAAAAARSGQDVRVLGWLNRDDAVRWLTHASLLVFPSRGPESLSRVLIEASALGIPIAAMNTGGTADIVSDEQTGLLSETPQELADDVRRLRNDDELRSRLGAAARARAEALFDVTRIAERMERLYRELIAERGR